MLLRPTERGVRAPNVKVLNTIIPYSDRVQLLENYTILESSSQRSRGLFWSGVVEVLVMCKNRCSPRSSECSSFNYPLSFALTMWQRIARVSQCWITCRFVITSK